MEGAEPTPIDAQMIEDVSRAVYVSNVCETFSCLPVPSRSAAEQPLQLVHNIMAVRNYRQADGMVKGTVYAGSDGPPPAAAELLRWVQEARLIEDRWCARQAEGDDWIP